MGTVYDDHEQPLLRMRITGVADDAEIAERIAWLHGHLVHGDALAVVLDSREGGPLTASQRKMWVDWLRANNSAISQRCVGCAIVAGSGIAKNMYTAIFWIWHPPMPVLSTVSIEEATAWARAKLGEAPLRSGR